jgi:hypothetical protein
MPKYIDVAEYAQEATESIINGNATYVIQQITNLPKPRAMAVIAYVIHYLSEDDGLYRDQVPYLLRCLTSNL